MRHLGSIVLSLLLAPVIYVLTGVGMARLSATSAHPLHTDNATLIGLGALVGAGVLYAVLMMARISPVGPLLAGLGYLALAGWFHENFASLVARIPVSQLKVHSTGAVAPASVAVLLAVPLLATVVSPRRWRRWGDRQDQVGGEYGTPPGSTPTLTETTEPFYSAAPSYPTSPADTFPYSSPAAADTSSTEPLPASGTSTKVAAPSESPVWPVRDD